MASALTLATTAPGAAQGYNTSTIVAAKQNQCLGVPDCHTEVEPAVVVPPRGQALARLACPASHPHLWGWDVAQHEHISVKLASVDRRTATIAGTNMADVEGHFVVHLGCSTAPYAGSVFLRSQHLAPSGWLGPRMRSSNAADTE